MPFFNPFSKNDHTTYHGVVIPLSSAPAHARPQSPAVEKKGSPNVKADDTSLNKAPSQENGSAASIPETSHLTIEALRAEIESDVAASGYDSAYDRKSKVINRAIQDIGMGLYQWELFCLCGFGWLADNLWLQGVALVLPPVASEFGISQTQVRFTTCALFVGLCLGATIWGCAADVIGRRPAFNLTLFICGAFGLATAGSPTWIGVCALFACLGLGVGGNLPVDGALFLEFLPFASGNLLTMLSVWWPVGQVIASLIAWGFIPTYSCADSLPSCHKVGDGVACCGKHNNMGWRYFVLTMGALTILMFICRFFLFHLYESPKFLLARGRQEDAVATVHGIAYKNKAKTWLTVDILNEIGGYPAENQPQALSNKEIIQRYLSKFSLDRVRPLFATKKLGITTLILWFCWTTIGMGYPLFNAFLPQYLKNAGGGNAPTSTYITYRNYAITSIVGVPGSIIACYTVDVKYIGRKGTITFATMMTAVLLFCFTTSTDSNIQLVCSCLEAFFQNIMYGVLYAYTPEVFPAPSRGTGTGIASMFNRIAGLCAPIVAVYGGAANPHAPVFAAGGLILAAFVAMLCLPIETMGKQSL